MYDYDEHRRRMVAEVSEFITWGLSHPDEVRWIPRKPIGQGSFSQAMQQVYWRMVFGAGEVAPRQLLRRFIRWASGA